MPSNTYQKEAKQVLDAFLARAFRYETAELAFLAKKWEGVSDKLDVLIQELATKEIKSLDQLYKLDLYQKFLRQSQFEVAKFTNLAIETVKDGQSFFTHIGLDATQDMIGLVTTRFNHIPFNAVNNLIGLSSQGSKLETLFAKSYPQSVEKLTQTLINATAFGWNPEKTARLLAANMDGNLARAMTIARTEQMNVLRITSIEQMQQSGVVKGWIRVEQDDAPDELCQEMNGKHFKFDEPFDTHPNCRGATVPDI